MATPSSLLTLLLIAGTLFRFYSSRMPARHRIIPPSSERIIIFGASSGTGAAIAKYYAHRGCRHLVLVARRIEQLQEIREECLAISKKKKGGEMDVICVSADCTKDTDVVNVRKVILEQLGGIDTVHITLGVSALLPLLGIAGVDPVRPTTISSPSQQQQTTHASSFALSSTYTAVSRACTANITSTALLLTTFTPILQLSSPAPAIHILSSLAALFPAPTRALYGATKAAQLILAQGFELETQTQAGLEGELTPQSSTRKGIRKRVNFVYLCPGTILSGFRQSAVDVPVSAADDEDALKRAGVFDSTWDSNSTGGKKKKKSDGLRPEDVAAKAIGLVDSQRGGVHTMKLFEFVGRIALVIAPWIPARVAHKKYGY
ncbi:hypothetical protein A4X09_0g584 [Tilletia walkeri]|uniref:NAD(P)-binding protein n=1 Tax=Tilletia walkeri TaxID=117179 RepID=A0A8X7ND50_9BASI|nr:hypothetical protein A4X09_0g584 [Tilletia walkeri]